MESTPASLLERVRQRDDAESWSRFVELYTPVIYGWARRIGLQESDACDVVQDVLAILLQKIGEFRYDPDRSFRAWLKTVALNRVRERQRRGAERPYPDGDGRSLADSAESQAFWDAEYRRDLLRRAVSLMQSDFHPTTWKACWETVVQGRPAAQVAAELGIKVGAVYAARFRVVTRLREELAGMLE
jgi:RNA polymerase sigma-70 factor (ECF subfamily)